MLAIMTVVWFPTNTTAFWAVSCIKSNEETVVKSWHIVTYSTSYINTNSKRGGIQLHSLTLQYGLWFERLYSEILPDNLLTTGKTDTITFK